MWKFTIKQDKLTVVKGFSEDKGDVISEALHYATMYCTEDFSKMVIEIKKEQEQ